MTVMVGLITMYLRAEIAVVMQFKFMTTRRVHEQAVLQARRSAPQPAFCSHAILVRYESIQPTLTTNS